MLNLLCGIRFTTSMTDVIEGLINVVAYDWHLSGTVAVNASVPHAIGITITLLNHISAESFFLYHRCGTASSSCQVPLSSRFRGLVETVDVSLSVLKISKGTGCVLHASVLLFMKAPVWLQTAGC